MLTAQMDIGLLVLRVVFGVVLAGHGVRKLFGWFGGSGLTGFSETLHRAGLRPAGLWAWISALAETFGGLILVLGLLTPVATGLLIANMFMAIVEAHWRNGFWNANRGIEFPLALIGGLLAIGLAGPGDYALGLNAIVGLSPLALFVATLVLGAIGVVIALATGLRHPERRTAS
jgi:putative oxidoreductase